MSRDVKRFLIYQGPSMLDRSPIMAVLRTAGNNKTAGESSKKAAHELWILPDDGLAPFSNDREDGSHKGVCGDCPFGGRYTNTPGKRACYVDPRGVNSIHDAMARGSYVDATTEEGWAELVRTVGRARALQLLRLGSWGDAAALPIRVVRKLVRVYADRGVPHVGYTHQWRRRPSFKRWLMASTTPEDDAEARALGWETFCVTNEPSTGGVMCPASDEWKELTGRKTTCARCRLCTGDRRSVWIPAHGPIAV